MEKQYQMKCKTQRTTENPKQTPKFGLGVLHTSMTQETADDVINTARVAVLGAGAQDNCA